MDKQIGVTLGFYARNGEFFSDKAKAEADEIAKTGIKWVVLVPTVAQKTYSSTTQFRDFELTPSDLEVYDMINYLHSLGISVMLRPMLETLDGLGRLQIWFPNDTERIPGRVSDRWKRWFESMRLRSVHYARIAERTGCEVYCLDSELDRTVEHSAQWKSVIDAVREVYSGKVTSCHTSHAGIVDFDKALSDKDHWFYSLDFLSISCYHKCVTKPGASVEEMKEGFIIERDRFRRYAKMYQKPILFGETGCTSSFGGAMSPSGWSPKSHYDGAEQANYLSAVFETCRDEPWWGGLYWWKWDEKNVRQGFLGDPNGDKGFIIKGKPAQEVMRKWCGKI